MEADGRITRIGGGLFVEIPEEVLRDLRLTEGQTVRILSSEEGLRVFPAVDAREAEREARDYFDDFASRYDRTLRNLSSR